MSPEIAELVLAAREALEVLDKTPTQDPHTKRLCCALKPFGGVDLNGNYHYQEEMHHEAPSAT